MNISYQNLLFEELSGENTGIALLTFNRPKVLNAINHEMMVELSSCLDRAKENKKIRVLVLTGSGDKAFVAGADISQFETLNARQAYQFAIFGQTTFGKLQELDQPTIAAVNGFALGGGCELASACDFIYASTRAKFGQPEVNLGIIPGYGGTQRFVRQVGLAMGKELIFSGNMISAEEAFRIGLVNKVCEPERLLDEVFKIARTIASRAPLAVAEAKGAMDQGYHKEWQDALAIEAEAFSKAFDTTDQKEGARAFLERRQPRFEGR